MKQKTGRKLLSFLLTLAMVVGLMPGMSLTAYAESKNMTLNAVFVQGDTIQCGDGVYFNSYHGRCKMTGDVSITYINPPSGPNSFQVSVDPQYEIVSSGNSGRSFYLTDYESGTDTSELNAFKVTGGNGTYDSPFELQAIKTTRGSYVDGSGESQTVNVTELEDATTNWTDGSWYIVPEGGLTISSRITVNGTVNLILRDGATLTANAGITTTNATLNIYAQSAGTGALTATGSNGCAGIGGCVGGYGSTGGAGGTVSIFGGTVTATGGTANSSDGAGAGIGGGGGGLSGNGGAGGTVSIFGGTVTATGGAEDGYGGGAGAGIGGGGKGHRRSAGASGTLTLGVGVKLYNGTDNSGTVLDGSNSTERSYNGSRSQKMFAKYSTGPDKSALNTAISDAETLYDSIKDNNDYTEVANTLKAAIDAAKEVANSETADQDAVNVATTNITTAKINTVIGMIDKLPATVTAEDKEKIEAVRSAYNSLSDSEKTSVTNSSKLTEAETALKTAIKNELDTAIDEAEAYHESIKGSNPEDAAALLEAINAAKAVKENTDATQTEMENAITALAGAKETAEKAVKVNELGTAIDDADEYYNSIKEKDPGAAAALLEAINAAKSVKNDAEATKEAVENAAAALADAKVVAETVVAINALPTFNNVTADNKADIEAARTAYNALTTEQKNGVSAETLKKLTDAEDKLAVLQAMSEVSAKTGSDMTYTGNPIQLINTPTTALPAGYTMKYAVTTENTAPTDDNLYTTSIPAKTDAGTYYVWYKVAGDGNHLDSDAGVVNVVIYEPGSPDIPTPTPTPTPVTPETTPPVSVSYGTHIQSKGWEDPAKKDGEISGTTGESKRLEAIKIDLAGNENVGIQYTTHVQGIGWMPWSCNGEVSGTTGESKRLEAIKIQLTGADKDKYDVYYRVHAQSYGWMAWAKNGEAAGTAGQSKRLEAIQVVVVEKGAAAPGDVAGVTSAKDKSYLDASNSDNPENPQVSGEDQAAVAYRTHVQTYGWQNWKANGQMAGTTGQSKRLEAININISNKPYAGGIRYKTHVQTYGWQDFVADGAASGTSGESKRLEAICIELTGEMAEHYDVYYRVHAQTYGWLDWASNGAPAGTEGLSKRLEGIEIVLVEKGAPAPGATDRPFVK